jgi:hypothetical protein
MNEWIAVILGSIAGIGLAIIVIVVTNFAVKRCSK